MRGAEPARRDRAGRLLRAAAGRPLPGVGVRDFEPSDRSACLTIFASNVPDFFSPEERAELAVFLDALPGPYVVLEADGEVVGCGGYAYREDGRVADLCWGMIRRDLHGCGLGRRLTEERLRRALRDPGVDAVALSTSQHTIGFYERLGFRVVSVEKDGFAPGLDRCDMRRDA